MKTGPTRLRLLLLLSLVIIAEVLVYIYRPFWSPDLKSTGDLLFLSFIILHGMWFYALLRHRGEALAFDIYRLPEVIFIFGASLFLFSYIFATNANLTYAQLFAETSGNLSLAPNSRIQRLTSMVRYLPLLGFDLGVYLYYRLHRPDRFTRYTGLQGLARWSLLLAILSGLLYSLSLPSFLSTEGFGWLAYVALVPLWSILNRHRLPWGIFYGLSFALVQIMVSNYWLGTFSLITLQLVTIFLFSEFLLYFAVVLPFARRMKYPHILFFPATWVLFDFIRTQGFLGYPWGMLGSSQYRYPPLIQIADIGGVYIVTLFVMLTSGLLLEIGRRLAGKSPGLRPPGGLRHPEGFRPPGGLRPPAEILRPLAALLIIWTAVLTYGLFSLVSWDRKIEDSRVRIALIQQNTDPRKHEYRDTFNILKKLTDTVLPAEPDLIAWSETAFVPNIRKWGALDPERYSLSRLVLDFREYQRDLRTWLITGNDDYEESYDSGGNKVYSHYNASVLFSDRGVRTGTYRKLHLVPFSEYFPYTEQFPWVFDILRGLDPDLWEKGEELVIFRHPKFTFFTPICFEDSFPGEIRDFVREGADVILNLSNDYWSLTEVEGQQHFGNSLFRAVENRRPLLRSTASGLTAYVSPDGRIQSSLPYYQEGTLTADVKLYRSPDSLYLRYGNWMMYLLAGASVLMAGCSIPAARTVKKGRRQE